MSMLALAARRVSPLFRRSVGISGIVTMAAFFGFMIANEQVISHANSAPTEFIARAMGKHRNVATQSSSGGLKLMWHESVLNAVYDSPFKTVAAFSVPAIAGLFAHQNQNAAIKFSQKVMHTRVLGQGYVVLCLAAVMAFHDYIDTHGRFVPHIETAAVDSDSHSNWSELA